MLFKETVQVTFAALYAAPIDRCSNSYLVQRSQEFDPCSQDGFDIECFNLPMFYVDKEGNEKPYLSKEDYISLKGRHYRPEHWEKDLRLKSFNLSLNAPSDHRSLEFGHYKIKFVTKEFEVEFDA